MKNSNVHVVHLLSMSKLSGADREMHVRQQTPDEVAKVMHEVESNFPEQNVSHSLLYTDALYFNSNSPAEQLAQKLPIQMAAHVERFKKLNGTPDNVEFISWNQIIADGGSKSFESGIAKLNTLYAKDQEFSALVRSDTKAARAGKIPTDADIQFILHELLVFEQIRRRVVQTPLMKNQPDILAICYPGEQLASDQYLQTKHKYPVKDGEIDRLKNYQTQWINVSKPDETVVQQSPDSLGVFDFLIKIPLQYKKTTAAVMAALVLSTSLVSIFRQNSGNTMLADDSIDQNKWRFDIDRDGSGVLHGLTMRQGKYTVYFQNPSDLMDQAITYNGKLRPITDEQTAYQALGYEKIAQKQLLLQNP